jgi:hypothetical protein
VEERHPRWALITGATMLGSAYVTGLLFASEKRCTTDLVPNSNGNGIYTSSCDSRWALAVPVVGPFVDMSKNKNGDDLSTDILLSGGQVAGAVILIIGLATTTPKLIPDSQGFSLTPVVGPGTAGLALTLRQ